MQALTDTLQVIVGTKVLTIGNIQDINLKFRVKFILSLQWLDRRHTYKNLKTGNYIKLFGEI